MQMVRDLAALQDETFDLLVSGAGIFGACAAWDAALRGYKVALIDREDFGSGVSAESYKIVHGGIRYIQHFDVPRVRSSAHERSTLLRIAPHLVHPLPIAIPTYGYGTSGKPFLAAGMYLYDTLTADRNRGIGDPTRRIPWTRLMSRKEVLEKFPDLDDRSLTGAALFHDAQMYNPPRLVLSFVQSAASRGATVCNYVGLRGFRMSGDRIEAARVRDTRSGEDFDIRAKCYLNSMGPWSDRLLAGDGATAGTLPGIYSRDACFVVKRRFDHDISVALLAQTRDPDALFSRPARHIFVVPWRDYSLIGTWHKVVDPSPDDIGLAGEELDSFIDEVHSAYPALALSRDDVTMCNWGLVPFGEEQKDATNLSYGKRSLIVDHARKGGPQNLVSLVGIRYTMGRGDSAVAMRDVARKLKDDRAAPRTDELTVHGGDVADMRALADDIRRRLPAGTAAAVADSLARNYGSGARALIEGAGAEHLRPLGRSHVLEAEIVNAVENEMATDLADVVFRRTDLASGGSPGEAALRRCCEIIQPLLGLSDQAIAGQLEAVSRRIPGWQ